MTHVSEEQLVLFHYGDADDHGAIREHLEACDACLAEYERLRQVLDAVSDLPVPERGAGYGDEVWQRVHPQIATETSAKTTSIIPWRTVGWVAAAAAALVLAFLSGRLSQEPEPQPQLAQEDTVNKVLLVAMNEHLERTSMMLVELLNADGNGTVRIGPEQSRARELVADNRLYRQAAKREGDKAMAMLLDQIERVLMEVANAPSEMPSEDYDIVRRDIKDDGLLFKVRVLQSHVDFEEAGARDSLPGAI